jgi:hypothetical protein
MSRGESHIPQPTTIGFPPLVTADHLQTEFRIGNENYDFFFNVGQTDSYQDVRSGSDINHSILAQNDFGRFAVGQLLYGHPYSQRTPQAYQPTNTLQGRMEILSGHVPSLNFNMERTLRPNRREEVLGGDVPQNVQPVLDPHVSVLQASLNQSLPRRPRPTSAFGLDSILHIRMLNEESLECPISADTLARGEWVSRMPCGHYFATESLSKWIRHNHTCPVCRFELHTGNILPSQPPTPPHPPSPIPPPSPLSLSHLA